MGRGDGFGREPSLAAAVSLLEDGARGPGSVAGLRVESRSPGRAFVTVVGRVPGRRLVVHYREGQRFIEVAPRGVSTLRSLPASFDGARAVLVVLSHTPAGEEIRQIAGDLEDAGVGEAGDKIRSGLYALGFRGLTIEVAPPADRKD